MHKNYSYIDVWFGLLIIAQQKLMSIINVPPKSSQNAADIICHAQALPCQLLTGL